MVDAGRRATAPTTTRTGFALRWGRRLRSGSEAGSARLTSCVGLGGGGLAYMRIRVREKEKGARVRKYDAWRSVWARLAITSMRARDRCRGSEKERV